MAIKTGRDRLEQMFKLDEYGSISPELNAVHQAGFLGFLIGGIYGGVITSKISYSNFMENNQATAFKSHIDAKRKLQDQFTVSFARGAFKWGWRAGLFTVMYTGITTSCAVYRGKSSIFEYILAGATAGSLYKTSLGCKGMVVGGLVGGTLGGAAGAFSLIILHATGTSMEDIRYWQHQWKVDRHSQVQESLQVAVEDRSEIVKNHDVKHGSSITLQSLK